MSDGLKVGLIFGGVAVVGYFVWSKSQAASTLGAATGAPPVNPTATQQLTASSPGSGVAPAIAGGITGLLGIGPKVISGVANTAVSTVTKLGSTFYNADKTIVKGAVSTVSAIGSGAVHVASSAVHSILSIF